MSAVTQCDTCRKLGPMPPAGWLALAEIAPVQSPLMAALSGVSGQEDIPTFCSYACAAQYAAAKALISSAEGSTT